MVRFRLLHLSDFHFGQKADVVNVIHRAANKTVQRISDVDLASLVPRSAREAVLRPTSHSRDAAFGLAKFCYDQQKNYDAIIVTGDLAATGQKSDLEVASAFLSHKFGERFYDHTGRFSIGNIMRKRYIIPGNHDRYVNLLGVPGSLAFDSFFENIFPTGKKVYSRILKKPEGYCGIVFGDFCLKKISDVETAQLDGINLLKGTFGRGHVYTEILEKLKTSTAELKHEAPGIYVIWAIHFAPFECGDDLKLQDYPKLLEAAKSSGVNLILCGHTHKRNISKFDGINIACAGTACSNDELPTHLLHIVDLSITNGKAKIRHEDYQFAPDDGEFVRLKSS